MIKNNFYVYGEEDVTIPAHVNVAKDLVQRMLQYKQKTALINASTGASVTYGQLLQQTIRIASWLTELGVKKGDVIGVCSEKRFEVIPTILGIMSTGAVVTNINFGTERVKHRINTSKPQIIIFSPLALKANKDALDEINCTVRYITYDQPPFSQPLDEPLDESLAKQFEPVSVKGWMDNAIVIYSSGTTDLPKGIPVTHLSLMLNLIDFASSHYEGKSLLNIREWYFTYGILHTLACMRVGTTVVFTEGQTKLDHLETIQQYQINIIQATPYDITEIVKCNAFQEYDVSSVEIIVSAGSLLDGDLYDAVNKSFPKLQQLIQLYGVSELGTITHGRHGKLGTKPGSVGTLSPLVIVKVVDVNTREPLGANQRGEICFKSPKTMAVYLGETTLFPEYIDNEGFFMTGDIGYYDEDKYFFVVDRIKEFMKCDSHTVSPAEIEGVLLQHPLVRDAGVAGAKHPKHGDAPTAFVVLQPGANVTAEEIVGFVNDRVPPYMQLTGGAIFLDELPRRQGKLDRTSLKKKIKNTM